MHNFKLLLKNLIKLILVLLVPVIALASNQDNFIPFHLHNVDKSCQPKGNLNSELDENSNFSLSVNNTINLDTPDFEADLFTVFPNLSQGDVRIISNQPIKDIRIYKSYGKLTHQIINVKRNSIRIDLKSYSRGMYFIEITNQNNHRSTQKLLLK